MTTLRPHNEVVADKSVFDDIRDIKIDPEMSEIAALIIEKKVTKFDLSVFEDTYENALIEMIKAKQQGKKPPKPTPRPKRMSSIWQMSFGKAWRRKAESYPGRSKAAARKKAD